MISSKAGKAEKRPSYISSLEKLLSGVEHSGDFATQGVEKKHPAPGLWVDGMGCIALPLLAPQATQLKGVCEQAPFGRGEKTLVDKTIRNALQLSPEQFQLKNTEWASYVEEIASKACNSLGVPPKAVTAELYKLVLYEAGSFFVPHRDTEKADGMFGTLVIVLPSIYKGGELIIAHAGQTRTFHPSADGFSSYWAAFYADCKHELKPVTDGHRLCLIYNLIQSGADLAAKPPDRQRDVQRLYRFMQQWQKDDAGPEKLIYQLEHVYSPEGIRGGLVALKGKDRAAAAVLHEAEQCGLDVGIATFRIEHLGHGYYKEHANIEMAEYELTGWTTLNGKPESYDTLSVDIEEEVIPALSEADLDDYFEWDVNEFEEATGNEGGDLFRQYAKACLVIWRPDELEAPVKAAAQGAPQEGKAKPQSKKRKGAVTAKV
ncbi:hypothetical protein CVIRNUC_002770 [Coccomyxa viridis]|uniref:Prolyl 4-hydroxylase alpha subunit Fe(2+) 2OG dioxygenase domain-containing protein n=1 Tax=Coccomyxa viridis TaxID=1274662 RepID=A0AAV1HWQ7_9CHLO|nr:hypothetical protein CVIRNUC_002770 [Coccomyxa viridis]